MTWCTWREKRSWFLSFVFSVKRRWDLRGQPVVPQWKAWGPSRRSQGQNGSLCAHLSLEALGRPGWTASQTCLVQGEASQPITAGVHPLWKGSCSGGLCCLFPSASHAAPAAAQMVWCKRKVKSQLTKHNSFLNAVSSIGQLVSEPLERTGRNVAQQHQCSCGLYG